MGPGSDEDVVVLEPGNGIPSGMGLKPVLKIVPEAQERDRPVHGRGIYGLHDIVMDAVRVQNRLIMVPRIEGLIDSAHTGMNPV